MMIKNQLGTIASVQLIFCKHSEGSEQKEKICFLHPLQCYLQTNHHK